MSSDDPGDQGDSGGAGAGKPPDEAQPPEAAQQPTGPPPPTPPPAQPVAHQSGYAPGSPAGYPPRYTVSYGYPAAAAFTPVLRQPWINPTRRGHVIAVAVVIALLFGFGGLIVGHAVARDSARRSGGYQRIGPMQRPALPGNFRNMPPGRYRLQPPAGAPNASPSPTHT